MVSVPLAEIKESSLPSEALFREKLFIVDESLQF